jgi:plasmid stability protein
MELPRGFMPRIAPKELLLKDVPQHLMHRLRVRAGQNDRTVEDELYAILEDVLLPPVLPLLRDAPQRDDMS